MGVSNIIVGNVYHTKNFGDIEVICYIDKYNVDVKFLNTGTITRVKAAALRSGSCVDRNVATFLGIGYVGYGKYNTRELCGKKKSRAYDYWSRMLKRCYCVHSKDYKDYGLKGVTVCESWYNFQNFAEWFYSQPNCGKIGYHLDKDLTILGNKIYQPSACELIPPEINTMGVFKLSDRFSKTTSGKWRFNKHGGGFSGSYEYKRDCLIDYLENKRNGMISVLTEHYSQCNISNHMYERLIMLVNTLTNLTNWE
jgi:hypothetical protein